MKNNGLMAFSTLGVILLGFIAPLVAFINKDKLTPEEKAIIVSLFNFEISYLIITVAVGIVSSYIPFAGLINLIFAVINIVYGIQSFMAARENKPFNAFTVYDFVK
jgi:uncharacterized membrane protein